MTPPGSTSSSTTAPAPMNAPSPMVMSPSTRAPAPMVTWSPIVGAPCSSVKPMVTCWLIQKWLPMDLAATSVAMPCWMKQAGPRESGSKMTASWPL